MLNVAIIISKGIPWRETIHSEQALNISNESFAQLLDLLNLIHQNNIVHRDIRAPNIYLFGEKVKIGDFSSSCRNKLRFPFAGGWNTASQSSLEAGILGKEHVYTEKDDLESLFKTHLLWMNGLTVPIEPSKKSRKRISHEFWQVYFNMMNLTENMDAEDWRKYLTNIFTFEPTQVGQKVKSKNIRKSSRTPETKKPVNTRAKRTQPGPKTDLSIKKGMTITAIKKA